MGKTRPNTPTAKNLILAKPVGDLRVKRKRRKRSTNQLAKSFSKKFHKYSKRTLKRSLKREEEREEEMVNREEEIEKRVEERIEEFTKGLMDDYENEVESLLRDRHSERMENLKPYLNVAWENRPTVKSMSNYSTKEFLICGRYVILKKHTLRTVSITDTSFGFSDQCERYYRLRFSGGELFEIERVDEDYNMGVNLEYKLSSGYYKRSQPRRDPVGFIDIPFKVYRNGKEYFGGTSPGPEVSKSRTPSPSLVLPEPKTPTQSLVLPEPKTPTQSLVLPEPKTPKKSIRLVDILVEGGSKGKGKGKGKEVVASGSEPVPTWRNHFEFGNQMAFGPSQVKQLRYRSGMQMDGGMSLDIQVVGDEFLLVNRNDVRSISIYKSKMSDGAAIERYDEYTFVGKDCIDMVPGLVGNTEQFFGGDMVTMNNLDEGDESEIFEDEDLVVVRDFEDFGEF